VARADGILQNALHRRGSFPLRHRIGDHADRIPGGVPELISSLPSSVPVALFHRLKGGVGSSLGPEFETVMYDWNNIRVRSAFKKSMNGAETGLVSMAFKQANSEKLGFFQKAVQSMSGLLAAESHAPRLPRIG